MRRRRPISSTTIYCVARTSLVYLRPIVDGLPVGRMLPGREFAGAVALADVAWVKRAIGGFVFGRHVHIARVEVCGP